MSEAVERLRLAALAVCDRWDSPDWKDQRHTGDFIRELRAATAALTKPAEGEPVAWLKREAVADAIRGAIGHFIISQRDAEIAADAVLDLLSALRAKPAEGEPAVWPDRDRLAVCIASHMSFRLGIDLPCTENDKFADAILALLSASTPNGYKLVPVEPTKVILAAMRDAFFERTSLGALRAYAALLSASDGAGTEGGVG